MEIINKDIKQIRFTLTPTRTTLKFPLKVGDIDRVVTFAQAIADKHAVSQSYRGAIKLFHGQYTAFMATNDDRNHFYCKEEDYVNLQG